MRKFKRVLFVDNVVSPSGTNIRPREHRGIDTILESCKYRPYIVVSEPVLIQEPTRFFKTRSFDDHRVETYRVPCMILNALSSNRSLGRIGRLFFGICNALLQSIYLFHLTCVVQLLTLVKKIDILHAHNPPDLTGLVSFLVSRISGIPYVFEVHDRAPELYCGEMGLPNSSFVYRLMKSIERLVITNSAGIITVNESVAKYYRSFGGPTPVAIYTGVRIDKEFTDPLLDNHTLAHERVILYQGALNMTSIGQAAMYDLMLPLQAMPHVLTNHPNAVLVYVGEGSGRARLEKTARSLGLQNKVIFTGFLQQKQVFEWIRRAAVVLIPYADNPNCRTTVPTKLYEYIAVGKPIVATNFQGISEIIANGRNGLVYEVNNLEGFAECVMRILDDPQLAQEIASNAKKDFARYSLEKNWPKLISLYDSITK